MILVTGAYGFIGSNFIKYLNSKGISNIVVCDYLTNGRQFRNLNGCEFVSYIHPDEALRLVSSGGGSMYEYDRIFHFGAISDTTCWDGELVMERNTEYTIKLLQAALLSDTPISYSSSASVYGNGAGPLNLYAHSKWLVDKWVQDVNSPLIQGFRYFNVYADDDSEWHKGPQASPFYKFKQQALEMGMIEIFEGSEKFKRDFVHVDRVCEVQWEMAQRETPGIFDLGSGSRMSFEDVACIVAADCGITSNSIKHVPFPEHLKGVYQTNTLADMSYYSGTNVSGQPPE